MDWNKNQRDTFTIQGDVYGESAGESVQAISYTQPYSQIVDANAPLSGGNIMGRWKRVMSDGNDIQLQVYYDRTNRHEPNFGEIRSTFDIDFLQRIRLWARHQISWGLGARLDPVRDIEVVSGLTFTPSKRTDSLVTAFLQDEIGLVDHRLSLTLGTKLLHTNFTGSRAGAERPAAVDAHGEANRLGGVYARLAYAFRRRRELQSVRLHRHDSERFAVFRPVQRQP